MDDLDGRILQALQENADLTHAELAKLVHSSILCAPPFSAAIADSIELAQISKLTPKFPKGDFSVVLFIFCVML